MSIAALRQSQHALFKAHYWRPLAGLLQKHTHEVFCNYLGKTWCVIDILLRIQGGKLPPGFRQSIYHLNAHIAHTGVERAEESGWPGPDYCHVDQVFVAPTALGFKFCLLAFQVAHVYCSSTAP